MKKVLQSLMLVFVMVVGAFAFVACGGGDTKEGKIAALTEQEYQTAISTIANKLIGEDVDIYNPQNTDGLRHEVELSSETPVTEAEYFVKVAKLSDFDEVESVTVGSQKFTDTDLFLSIGNNYFIKSKAWKVDDDDNLYVAAPIVLFDFYTTGKIKVNDVEATLVDMTESTVTQKAFSKAAAAYDTSVSQSTVEYVAPQATDTILNATIKLKDGKQAVALAYDNEADASSMVLAKVVKNGVTSYAISKNEAIVDGKAALGCYPVAWKENVTDVATEYAADLNKTVEYSVFCLTSNGVTIYRANVNVVNGNV